MKKKMDMFGYSSSLYQLLVCVLLSLKDEVRLDLVLYVLYPLNLTNLDPPHQSRIELYLAYNMLDLTEIHLLLVYHVINVL